MIQMTGTNWNETKRSEQNGRRGISGESNLSCFHAILGCTWPRTNKGSQSYLEYSQDNSGYESKIQSQ